MVRLKKPEKIKKEKKDQVPQEKPWGTSA